MSAGYQGAPRPRVIVCGLTNAEIEEIRPLAGSLAVVDDPVYLSNIHPEEHDVLVATDADFTDHQLIAHRRVAFAEAAEPDDGEPQGFVLPSSSFGGPSITRARTQFKPARDFEVTQFAREQGVESLVRRSCLPRPGDTYTGVRVPVTPERKTEVFAWERLSIPLALAAVLESETIGPVDHSDRMQANESVLWLPDIARPYLQEWLRFAFARWREVDPDAFPESAEWKASELWASPDERAARHALCEFEEAEARRREAAERTRTELAAAVEAAGGSGERWRSILTDTGDELVASVKEVFEGFGFEVVDSDALPQNKSKKREDLRVSDGDWIALVEVKGYGGGAKSNDLQQVTGASTAFAASEGRAPDSLWYVVNAFREDDPGQRSVALVSRDDDLTSFAENHNGCLIDTRELFRMRQLVSAGQLSTDEARGELKAASARYTSPSGVKA